MPQLTMLLNDGYQVGLILCLEHDEGYYSQNINMF